MIQMDDDDDADFDLSPCERFSKLIVKDSLTGLLNCTVCTVDCLPQCDIQFVLTVLVPGIKKLLNIPNGSVVESMLMTLPDFCELLADQFPNDSEHLLITEFIPETCRIIEKVGDIIGDAAAETFAALLTLLTKEDFEEFELPVLKQLLSAKKKEVRIIIGQVLTFISDYFPCNTWFDQLYELLTVLSTDSLGSVRSAVPSLISIYSKNPLNEKQQNQLIGRFQLFCRDKSILVRKAAAESLVALSQALDENMRIITVIPATNTLLNDPVEAVRSVILRNLGPLISSLGSNADNNFVSKFTDALNSTDPTIAFASAFAFPAVALALGHDRWNELKEFFDIAIMSREFRIRRTLAFGLVSFGFIVDQNDLCDIACGFLRDLPSIAVGIIMNLHQIILMVDCKESLMFCLQYPTEKYHEWRIRLHVSEQLRYCIDSFDRSVLYQSAKELIIDEVATVRNDAAISFAMLLEKNNISDLEEIAKSDNFHHRIAAANVLNEVDIEIAKQSLYILKCLSEDRVPNVRVAAIKAAVSITKQIDIAEIAEIVEEARKDSDVDVQKALLGEIA